MASRQEKPSSGDRDEDTDRITMLTREKETQLAAIHHVMDRNSDSSADALSDTGIDRDSSHAGSVFDDSFSFTSPSTLSLPSIGSSVTTAMTRSTCDMSCEFVRLGADERIQGLASKCEYDDEETETEAEAETGAEGEAKNELERVQREIEALKTGNEPATEGKPKKKERVRVRSEDGLAVMIHPQEGKEPLEYRAAGELIGASGGNSAVMGSASAAATDSARVLESLGLDFRIVDEAHSNYVLMYDMLTGIRTAVSRCQAKPPRPLSALDFDATYKYAFDLTGSESTPSSRYDFKFKDYGPWVFRSLRESFGIDTADYLVSLTGKYILSELYSPGKSGSLFYYSQDYRFIIKTIRRIEHRFLRQILTLYHGHIQEHRESLLVKFYGLHRVQLPQGDKIYFVVMGNIFSPSRPLRAIYDLKGSTFGRYCDESETTPLMASVTPAEMGQKPGPRVLKDLNWLERRENLVLGPLKATLLMSQLREDCKFLARLRIMDYSLLIGLHQVPEGGECGDPNAAESCAFYSDAGGFRSSFATNTPGPEIYYLGIIDILTPYTLKKRLEHTFKSILHPKASISAVRPALYARRFLSFMNDHILQDVNADYGRRELPSVPETEEADSEKEKEKEKEKGTVAREIDLGMSRQ